MKKNRFIDYLMNILSMIAVMIFAVSFSAFIPCFFKGFYTPWINWLNIPATSHYSVEVIKNAYSNILDFIWREATFNPGIPMSESGISHFADCIPLFWMQLWMMVSSLAYLLIFLALVKLKKIRIVKLGKLPLYSYGGILLLVFLVVIAVFAVINFDLLFVIFHKVFFPGKENWQFNPYVDRVILILPENYFLVCAVYIVSSAIIIAVLFILLGVMSTKKENKKEFITNNYFTVVRMLDVEKIDKTCIKKLSKKEKEKVNSFKNDSDKQACLAARYLEHKYLNHSRIYYQENGKPYLKGDIQYNLSHKDKYVVMGLSSSPIGIDIEINRKLDDKLIDFSFSKAEIRNMEILNISPVKMWTIKEALLKCVGTGIKKKLNEEEIIFDSDKSFLYQGEKYYYKSFDVGSFFVSVVLEEDKLPLEVKYE